MNRIKSCFKTNLVLIATIISVILGVAIGMSCRLLKPSPDTVLLVGFPGEIFMGMLKMLILPLIVGSMITGLSNIDSKSAGKMGLAALGLYLATTLIATIVGLGLALTIRPGMVDGGHVTGHKMIDGPTVSTRDVFLDLLRNLFPENLVQGTFEKVGTTYVEIKPKHTQDKMIVFVPTTGSSTNITAASSMSINNTESSSTNISITESQWNPTLKFKPGTNTVGLIVYCVVFGVILGKLGDKGKVMLSFFTTLNVITMNMVQLVIWYSPFGILFLIAAKIMSVPDLATVGRQLGVFILTNIAGLCLHSLVVLPLIYLTLTRSNPFKVARGVLQALVMAAATDSSAATLPVTLRCCEGNLKLDQSITRFVLPIGATVNMDGTAVFQVIAAMFIAQLRGIDIEFSDGIVACLCAVLASVGAAAIPGGGVVALLVVLSALSLPTDDVYMILAINWFLGRLRCVVNVFGDCLAASILSHFFARGERAEQKSDTDYHVVESMEVV